ncbi:MAG TPA: ABC transporter permease [Terracidiphilus sp.]|nr:ABC transporter permease [Terracidiphilus sp.]
MGSFARDIRHSFRHLLRNPAFTTAAVATLALGIGANSTVFSIVNGLLFRSLPVPDPARLVAVGFSLKGQYGVMSYPDLEEIRKQAEPVADLFGYRIGTDGLSEGGRAEQIVTSYVTQTYFTGLGIKPAIGRLLGPAEGALTGRDSVVVLSYSYWKSRFSGDPGVVGRTVKINGEAVTVVGIAQKGFRGAANWMNVQAFLPLNMSDIDMKLPLNDRVNGRTLFVLGRLQPGVSLSHATSIMELAANRLAIEHPQEDEGAHIFLQAAAESSITPVPRPGTHERILAIAALFLGFSLLVLLMACLNLGSLLLVRNLSRQQEMAVRAALGAQRWTLARHLITESLLLTAFGCIGGVIIGVLGSRAVQGIHLGMGVPIVFDFGIDLRVFVYAVAIALLAGLTVGLVPAIRVAWTNPGRALHDGGYSVAGGRQRLRVVLVIAQISSSLLLLIVAGLFARSLFAVQHANLGFNPDHVLKMILDPHGAGFDAAREQQFYTVLLQKVRALPSVQNASISFTYPSEAIAQFHPTYVRGRAVDGGKLPPDSLWSPVSPGYFETLEIPLLRGRLIQDSDNASAPPVAVVNSTMAQQLWHGADPLGEHISISGASGPWIEVVGVVQDSVYQSLFVKNVSCLYLPIAQQQVPLATLLVKTSIPPERLVQSVESQIHSLAPDLPVFGVGSLWDALQDSLGGFYAYRLGTYLTVVLGLIGFGLAIVGIYGVVAYDTSRGTREVGIRLALGGRPSDILWMILSRSMRRVIIGVALGLGLALLVSHGLAAVFYGARGSYDPLACVGVTLAVAATTMLACYFPARHAARTDPNKALRNE